MLFRLWEAVGLPDLGWVPDRVGVDHLLVGRHALVRQVFADPDTFRPDNALDAITPVEVGALRVLAGHGFSLPATLANNGTPSHPAVRELVARALHPDRVARQRPWLTGVVRRRVATLAVRLRAGETVDLCTELAADLPLLVLARLIDLPPDDVTVVKRFSRAALELFWAPVDPARQRRLADVVGEYHAMLSRFAGTAGGSGGAGGLVGALREQGLGPEQVVAALFFLLVAGQETTSQFLTLLLDRLIAEPGVTGALVAGRVRVEDVVEEGLRLDSPIETWRRMAAVDTRLGDVDVPAGSPVLLWLSRAGRDPALAQAPERFVPGQRHSRRHLAFGAGAHRCVGAPLARMEAAVVVAETAPLLRRVVAERRPTCPDNLSFRVPDTLLVTLPRDQANLA